MVPVKSLEICLILSPDCLGNVLLKYHSKAGESESKLWKFFVSLPAQSASGHHLGENEFWLNEDNYARNFLLASL